MADLKPIGSEKLEGVDKLRRIMEIATYRETPKTNVDNLSTVDYTIRLSDGNVYGIVKERQGYILKKGINESELDYSEPMKNRKYYRSYSEAMKKLNLIVAETNRITGNEYEIPLIGEQPEGKKKFVLKTNKKKTEPTDVGMETPPPAPELPAAEAPAPELPSDDMGGEMMPDMGGEMTPETGDEMGAETTPDMGEEEPPMATAPGDTDFDTDDEEGGPSNLKLIQKLTGKLSQKLRMFEKDKGLDSQDIKYVMNSIISAIDLGKLDDDDREDIVNKLEGFDEYGKEGEGELDFGVEDDFDADNDMGMGDEEMGDEGIGGEEMPEEPMAPEATEGYQNVMDSIFGESKVEKVLSNYFKIEPEEAPILENKNKLDYLKSKINKITQKEEVLRLSISENQTKKSLVLLEDYSNTRFIGKTNKNNLIFNINGKEVKVTPEGRTL